MLRFSVLFISFASAVFAVSGCVPHTRFNQSYLASEELKPTKSGYVSFNTGETLDISGILSKEKDPKNIVLFKIHGKILLSGDGFKNVWLLSPSCGKDEAGYEIVKISPSPASFKNPSMEKSGDCVILKWEEQSGAQSIYLNYKGQTNVEKCR